MFDPTADLPAIADGLETVTLLRRDDPLGVAGTRIERALRLAIVRHEPVVGNRYEVRRQVDTFGRFTAGDVIWRLPMDGVPAAPRLGDVLLDSASRRWTILEVQRPPLDLGWRCTARDLVLAWSLDNAVTVLQPVFAKGDGGAAEATWIAWRTGVRASIQPVRQSPANEHGAARAVTRARILLAENLPLSAMHRVLGPDGSVYRILTVTGAERLGEPQAIEAETL